MSFHLTLKHQPNNNINHAMAGQYMRLDNTVNIVSQCVSRYAKNNHCYLLSYVIYRIHQAVLHIFGQSEWQIAHRSLIRNIKLEFPRIGYTNQRQWEFRALALMNAYVNLYNNTILLDANNESREWRNSVDLYLEDDVHVLNIDVRLIN